MGFKFESHKDDVLKELEEAMDLGLEAVGLQAEGYAKEEITRMRAVDTGRLRGSITYATDAKHSAGESPALSEDFAMLERPRAGTVCIGTNVEYAPYIHDGTAKMAARPFLHNAIRGHVEEYKEILEEALKSTKS